MASQLIAVSREADEIVVSIEARHTGINNAHITIEEAWQMAFSLMRLTFEVSADKK